MSLKLNIIMPVLNDWESFKQLVQELDGLLLNQDCQVSITAMDDGSDLPFQGLTRPDYQTIQQVEVIQLVAI